MTLKNRIKLLKTSKYSVVRLIFYWSVMPLGFLRRFFCDPHFRYSVVTIMKLKRNYHQYSSFTKVNRYPLVFNACSEYLNELPGPRLLSYGCSTGEEVFTLAQYVPNAEIMGVDINKWCVRQCIKNYRCNNFSFYHRSAEAFLKAGSFDAVFCMAIFQNSENRLNHKSNNSRRTTFQQFEKDVLFLDKKLKPGGLLVIENSDFSFADTCVAAQYKPLDFVDNMKFRLRPLFDRNNKKIAETQQNYRVFVRGGG